MPKETKDLIVLDQLAVAIVVTKKDLGDGFEKIKEETKNIVPILDTKKGRTEYASLVHSVSKEKVKALAPLKTLIKGIKGAVKPLADLNKEYELKFNEYREKLREPLTDWETEDSRKKAEDKKRIGHIQERLKAIQGYEPRDHSTNLPTTISRASAEELTKAINYLQSCAFDGSSGFEEFLEEAIETRATRVAELQEILNLRKSEEKLASDQKLLKDAQDKLVKEKTDQKAETDRLERVRIRGLEEKMKSIKDCEYKGTGWADAPQIVLLRSRLRLITVNNSFEEIQEEAFNLKNSILETLDKGILLAEQADKEAAGKEEDRIVEKERLRVTKIAEAKKVIDDERKADFEHRRTINRKLVDMFMRHGYPRKQSGEIVTIIFNEKSPFLTINYQVPS